MHVRPDIDHTPLLTEAEAIRYLRLDEPDGPRDPSGTLRYYRQRGLLRGVRVGRQMRYTRWELEQFLHRLAERDGGGS